MKTTFTIEEVRRLMYQAYKHGQGGHVTDSWHGRLGLQNHRMAALRKLFPRIFGHWRPRDKKRKAAPAMADFPVPDYRYLN